MKGLEKGIKLKRMAGSKKLWSGVKKFVMTPKTPQQLIAKRVYVAGKGYLKNKKRNSSGRRVMRTGNKIHHGGVRMKSYFGK